MHKEKDSSNERKRLRDQTATYPTKVGRKWKTRRRKLQPRNRSPEKIQLENMSVFGLHFTNVLNNHRPVDYSVLNLLEQKPCMTSIDNPITFSEVKKAINKLKKGKLPGLNGIPPKALKAMYKSP
jgi:hypothetical protein